MSIGDNLRRAKKNKNDEFYTCIEDIEKELLREQYRQYFKDKIIYCNCDNYKYSNFVKFFKQYFNDLQIKGVIATYYNNKEDFSYKYSYNGNKEYIEKINCNGDFRSEECINILKQEDVLIITNPPFSLFREYIAQLITYDKKFIVIGNQNAITYKEIFPLIKDNKVLVGFKSMGKDMYFHVTDKYKQFLLDNKKEGSGYVIRNGEVLGRVSAIWYTNLDISKRHEWLDLYKEYTPEEYPKYDNYDAIEVSKVADIPLDYDGIMGVPITFLDKYCPEQFEIIGLAPERFSKEEASLQIKRYTNAVQYKADGTTCSGNKVNDGPVIVHDGIPKYPYYISETAPGKFLEVLYARILIRRKK